MSALERSIRRDPARRGLLSSGDDTLCLGHLSAAADHLARFGQFVWILTGFFIPKGVPPAAETDGPAGAAFLAHGLHACGIGTRILTDGNCLGAVQSAADAYGLAPDTVVACPETDSEVGMWSGQLLRSMNGTSLTHVISVERVGPAHNHQTWSDPSLSERFREEIPSDHWGRCHNMRGEIIDDVTPPLHSVVEWVAANLPSVRTIGIGDGGNEIGMGAIPYSELRRRLVEPQASLIPCRIATDWTILAGVSNWGAVALAAAACWQRGCLEALRQADRSMEEARLNQIVRAGPAVDGVTRLQEPTVDGLPFLTYLQPWEAMRTLLELE